MTGTLTNFTLTLGTGIGPGGSSIPIPVPVTTPLSGGTVRAYPAGQSGDPTVPAVGAATSGAAGTYTLSGLPAGQYDLVITTPLTGSHTVANVAVTAGGTQMENYSFTTP